jgi:hypothetical protein
MRTIAIVASAALLSMIPGISTAHQLDDPREAEGCQVQNPAQPTCTYTATHSGDSPASGIAGVGSWVVKIKIGKKKKPEVIKSPATGEPTAVEMTIPEGAKVTMSALTPGSGGTVGHVD